MRAKVGMAFVAAAAMGSCVASAAEEKPDATITFDTTAPAFKDQRDSRANPVMGWAGTVTDIGGEIGKYLFETDPDHTWEVLKEAGCHFVKMWSANTRWEESMAYAALKTDKERAAFAKKHRQTPLGDPKIYYDFLKKHDVKLLLCIEQYSTYTDVAKGETTNDIAVVKRHMLDYVKWIVDNGYRDMVVGFELGNEPYFGSEPEKYAERWSEIVPDMKKIFPEADIGFSIAEYRDGDPDIAAVRARSTRVDEWFKDDKEFGYQRVNQWSGRFIVAFSNCLDLCSHAIYHFYGGDIAYGVGPSGFARIRNFAKVFPEVKDKKVWVTEWRERSDEDNRCHLTHSSGLVKAHYMLSAICQPEIDGLCLHCSHSIAGVLNIADGHGGWYGQRDPGDNTGCGIRVYPDLDCTGHPRIEVGPCGPVFKLYTEALLKHPLIFDHGNSKGGSITNSSYWSGNVYYERTQGKTIGWHAMGAEPGKKPANTGNADWVLTASPDRTSAALLVCNTKDVDWKPTFRVVGGKVAGKPRVRFFRCREHDLWFHQTPGEPPPSWQEEFDGDPAALVVPAYTMATLVFPIEKEAKRLDGKL